VDEFQLDDAQVGNKICIDIREFTKCLFVRRGGSCSKFPPTVERLNIVTKKEFLENFLDLKDSKVGGIDLKQISKNIAYLIVKFSHISADFDRRLFFDGGEFKQELIMKESINFGTMQNNI